MDNISQEGQKPVLIYDGDCGFCCLWIARWSPITREEVDYCPSQEVGKNYPQIPLGHFESSVYFVDPDGRFCSGSQAVFKALAYVPNGKWFLRAYESIPGFAPVSEWGYRQVAQNRKLFSVLTRWIWGDSLEAPTWFLARRVFLFLLGLVYLVAFLSLWTQIEGLVGQEGILPAESYLKEAEMHWGPDRFWSLPTLFWLHAGDVFLRAICLLGAGASLFVMAHRAVGWSLLIAWGFYLSLFHVAQPFLGFQWDTLLLETGFLALFLAPWRRPKVADYESHPSRLVLFLFRFLLFRVVFSSGLVKVLSQDPTWKDFTALYYHYETQPLPTWIGWHAHQLPHGFQEFSVACVFAIQFGAVFLIFGPRRIRYAGCAVLIFHEILILLTCNYCFFNLLTIALCFLLLDDRVYSRWLPRSRKFSETQVPVWKKRFSAGVGAGVLGICLMLYTVPLLVTSGNYPSIYVAFSNAIRPLHMFNSYGLFAVMTTSRPEIIILGSDDREDWFPYEFKWKPGDIAKKPEFIAPHQPRLDWQMWFAALSNYERNPWLIRFMIRLLQGSHSVIALLEKNPFPDSPPKYLQAVVYDYRFADSETRSREGSWWTRKLLRPYTPILQLPNS
jgi:lipase maturation factor 1